MDNDKLTHDVISCAIEVHKTLGPGLLESTYEQCLLFELKQQGIKALSQVQLPVLYKGNEIDAGYRLDIIIPNQLIIELKAVDKVLPIHHAQTLTYMKLANINKALLINFNVTRLVDGIKRFVL
ncbi:MAG: GxxExxY protein [Flavobacteriaceae bacterium]